MSRTTTISGWGNYPLQSARVLEPRSLEGVKRAVHQEKGLVARGMGRSYGDSANADTVVRTLSCDRYIKFDDVNGILTAEAGVTLREVLTLIIPSGWFLPVTPGTSYVTLGGAIAGDVHGKNHHHVGSFGQYVDTISIVIGTGEEVQASRVENEDLFHATCGGMGLTGVILSASLRLISIRSSYINQKTIRAGCLEAACEVFEDNQDAEYSVAWIDCLAKGKNLGRSAIMLGEHAQDGSLELDIREPISVPFSTPAKLLNPLTMRAFNTVYWHKVALGACRTVPLMPYFYPLDSVGNWNKLYGKPGFLQFQFVVPAENGVANMRRLLSEIADSGQGSFLAVLKKFGAANDHLLSFPRAGYTLALDFKLSPSAIATIRSLEETIVAMGGRVYLSKDAVMRESTFKATYPRWEEFESVREKYKAIGKFSSMQSLRLGLA